MLHATRMWQISVKLQKETTTFSLTVYTLKFEDKLRSSANIINNDIF